MSGLPPHRLAHGRARGPLPYGRGSPHRTLPSVDAKSEPHSVRPRFDDGIRPSRLQDGAARAEQADAITQREARAQGFESGIALAGRQRRDQSDRPGEVAIEPQQPAGGCGPRRGGAPKV